MSVTSYLETVEVPAWEELVQGRASVLWALAEDGRLRACLCGASRRTASSERCRRVLSFAANGQPHKVAAAELGLSVPTVSGFLRAALQSTGIGRRETAVWLLAALSRRSVTEGAVSLLGGALVIDARLAAPSRARLTRAEFDVAVSIASGMSNPEIANRRNASPRTIANQLASLFRKLGVQNRWDLLRALVNADECVVSVRRLEPEVASIAKSSFHAAA